MSKRKLALIIGACAIAISIIAVIIVLLLPHHEAETPASPTYGLVFDGIDDHIVLRNATALGFTSENFTIEAWIKPDTVARRMQIFQRHGWNSDGYRFEVCPRGQLGFYTFQSRANQYTVTSLNVLTAGNWYHVAAVRQGKSVRIFVNGVDRTSIPSVHIDPAYVAHRSTGIGIDYAPEAFRGSISEVRVWNYARTESQIKARMYGNLTGSESGLVGYWKLDEGSGIIAHDSTANNNHGILYGDPVWFIAGQQQAATLPLPTYGLEFDGADDYVALGNAPALGFTSQNFTIEAWVRPDTVARSMQIFQRHGWNSDGYRFQMGHRGQLAFYTFQSGANQYTVTPFNVLRAGNWSHVAVVRQGASARIYVNGVDRTESAGSHIDPALDYHRNASIGTDYAPEAFQGSISEVRVWNYACTESQIKARMYGNFTGSESGLVGYWKLDEGFGIIAQDSTANSNHGTLYGDPVWFPQRTPPPYGLEFDGTDDYVALGNAPALGFTSENFTIEAWIKPGALNRYQQIFQRHGWNSDGYRFQMGHRGQLAFYTFQSGANQYTVTPFNVLRAGNWSHVAVVRQGASARIYVNGVDRTESAGSHIDPVYNPYRNASISHFYEPEVFDGVISEVRVWNYARTESQIKAGMYGNLTGLESGLVGYWKLDEGSGAIAHDSTANNNHGTLYGNPVWITSSE